MCVAYFFFVVFVVVVDVVAVEWARHATHAISEWNFASRTAAEGIFVCSVTGPKYHHFGYGQSRFRSPIFPLIRFTLIECHQFGNGRVCSQRRYL